jgi:hypothetical protein
MTRSFAGTALVAVLLAALLLGAPACRRRDVHVSDTIEEAPRLASTVRMGDPTMAHQLAGGFYGIEASAWRWTARRFAVNLRPPARSAGQGAVLELLLTVPPSSIAKLGDITLSASAGGAALAPETYSKAGEYTYRREVDAGLLAGDAVRIEFQLDKAVPPGDVDQRELGIVATSVRLVAK